MVLRWFALLSAWVVVQGRVVDPSLFLSPGPPLLPSSDELTPEERWNQHFETRVERDAELLVLPIEKSDVTATTADPQETDDLEKSETFWLSSRSASPTFGSQPYPLSFTLTGSYGGMSPGSGVVANRYTLSNWMNGGYGRTALAGSGYGSYPLGAIGTRVYGGNNGASWSGWGNGKWGHYGKG